MHNYHPLASTPFILCFTHNAIKSFIMSSAAPTPSNPYRVTPAFSKAASSIRSGRVVLHPPEAIDASVHRTSVTLTPRSLGNTTTTTSTSSGPLQPHRSPSRHRLLKSSPLPPIQSTPVELNHPMTHVSSRQTMLRRSDLFYLTSPLLLLSSSLRQNYFHLLIFLGETLIS